MFQWLSGFMLHPAMAVGAGAVAGPILIHIFAKRRFRRVRWAAMSFLLEALNRNRRRVRLEQLILLLLRCLVVLLIALMMTRPFLRPGALSSILGVGPRTERIVLLDDSYSMGYRPVSGGQGESVFARGKAAIKKIAGWVSQEAPSDSLALFVTSRPGEPVVAVPSLSQANLQRVREGVDGLRASQTVARPAAGMDAMAEAIRRREAQANAVVYAVSDFQRRDWMPAADAAGRTPPSPVAPLAALRKAGRSVGLVLVNVGEADAENVAISGLSTGQPQIVSGVPARFEVAVSNHSRRELDQVALSVAIAQHRLPPVMIPKIAPGRTVHEPIEITFPQDGADYVQVSLAGKAANLDGLQLDNTRALGVGVVPSVRVLIVDGEANNDPYRDEVYLLRTSLRPAGRAASGNDLTVVDDRELEEVELGPYHVVILANVGRVSNAARRKLETFAAAGGGVIVFAGDQIDIGAYNAELYRKGQGLLPVEVEEVAEPPPGAEMMTFARWDAGHPMLRSFVDKLAEALRQVRIDAYLKVRPAGQAKDQKLLQNPDEPRASARAARPMPSDGTISKPHGDETPATDESTRAPARVLARFNDADGSPAIVERRFGRGRCIFVCTSADQEWNDWASNFSYLPMMMEMVQYAARASAGMGQAVVDAPIVCPLDAGLFKRRGELRTPGYPVEPAVFLDAVAFEQSGHGVPQKARRPDEGGYALRYEATKKAGVYQFLLTTTSGESVRRFVAVNPDARESDLRVASEAELERALGDEMPFEYVADVGALVSQAAGARREFWWPLLVMALVVLMTEHVLAWWFGTRG